MHLQNFKGTGNNNIFSVKIKNLEVVQNSLHPMQCTPNCTPRWPKGRNQWWTSSASTEIYPIPSSISGLLDLRALWTIHERQDMQSLCFYCCAGKAGWADCLGPGRSSPKSTKTFLLISVAFPPDPKPHLYKHLNEWLRLSTGTPTPFHWSILAGDLTNVLAHDTGGNTRFGKSTLSDKTAGLVLDRYNC